MLLKKIKSILKRLLPASYKKIDSAESELLHAVNVLRGEIQNLHSELQKTQDQSNERINYLWQKIQDESNRNRDELNGKIDSVWQKVQDEANWKRDEIFNKLRLSEKYDELRFWTLYKNPDESEMNTKKRFFLNIPKATGGLRLLQKGEALLLEKFKDLCAKNNLQYWLYGGTLLGAVRHAGFIPWDDDLDVAMLRSDLKRLLLVLENDPEYRCTVLFDWWAKCKQIRFRFRDDSIPFFVDIFIYDVYEGKIEKNFENEFRFKLVDFFNTSDLPEVKYWREHPILDISDKYFQEIEKHFNKFTNKDKAILSDFSQFNEKTVLRASENCMSEKRGVYDKIFQWSTLFPLKYLHFEGTDYYVPNDTEAFLLNTYKEIFALPSDIFSHFEHIPHAELETQDFKNLCSELFMKYKAGI